MIIGLLRRLNRLETASRINVPRTFVLWDEGPEQVAAEQERLRREEGMTDSDRVIVVGWLPG
ncbi:MAG: hypothetical protein NVS2B5_05790 [Beijerinckiaceae bacterium]